MVLQVPPLSSAMYQFATVVQTLLAAEERSLSSALQAINATPPSGLPQRAEAACTDAAKTLKQWTSLESKLRQQIEERQKVLDAISGRGEACWSNLHHAEVATALWPCNIYLCLQCDHAYPTSDIVASSSTLIRILGLQEEVRKWQLRCAAVSAVCTILSGSVIGVYKRWLTRKASQSMCQFAILVERLDAKPAREQNDYKRPKCTAAYGGGHIARILPPLLVMFCVWYLISFSSLDSRPPSITWSVCVPQLLASLHPQPPTAKFADNKSSSIFGKSCR